MKPTAHQVGRRAEDLAAVYLKKSGFNILVRNYRHERAEIDIIAQKGRLLLFVEVKARTTSSFGHPETFVTPKQQTLLHQAAEQYIVTHNWNDAIRFDIIAIVPKKQGQQLTHFEDAF